MMAKSMMAKNITSSIKTFRTRLSAIKSTLKLPEKYRGGRIEKMVHYLQNVYLDYKQVGVDLVVESRDKPLKAASVVSAAMFIAACMKLNPNERDFENQLIGAHNDLSLVAKTVTNPSSYEHVMHLETCRNEKILRYQTFGVFSILYFVDYSPNCSLFAAQCEFLKPKWTSFLWDRIVDIGFFGKWRLLEHKMKDFDINEEEWKDRNLPKPNV